LLAIAFCRAHLLGEWLHEQKPIPIKSHHRPAIRIFRYGLGLAERDFIQYNGKTWGVLPSRRFIRRTTKINLDIW